MVSEGDEFRSGGSAFRRIQAEASHFDAVKERNSRVVTTTGAFVTVIEDPALSILKKDSHITEPSRNF